MIFKPDMIVAIAEGRKTQTRRKVQPGTDCFYRVGRCFGIQRRAAEEEMTTDELRRFRRRLGYPPRRTVGRLQVVAVRREQVGDITLEDARREGFESVAEFRRYWAWLHDSRWIARRAAQLGRHLADHELIGRFCEHHAGRPVWVITFEVVRLDRQLIDRLEVPSGAGR